MLTLHGAQHDHLADQKLLTFEQRCAAHLREHFPERAAFADEARQLAAVRDGIQAASLRGFHTEQEVVKYLTLRALLGSDFDLVPQRSPVAALLADTQRPPLKRLDEALELAAQAADAAVDASRRAPRAHPAPHAAIGARSPEPVR